MSSEVETRDHCVADWAGSSFLRCTPSSEWTRFPSLHIPPGSTASCPLMAVCGLSLLTPPGPCSGSSSFSLATMESPQGLCSVRTLAFDLSPQSAPDSGHGGPASLGWGSAGAGSALLQAHPMPGFPRWLSWLPSMPRPNQDVSRPLLNRHWSPLALDPQCPPGAPSWQRLGYRSCQSHRRSPTLREKSKTSQAGSRTPEAHLESLAMYQFSHFYLWKRQGPLYSSVN